MSSFRFSPSRSVIFKQACSVPKRSAIPEASSCSDSGFRTENFSEELPLLITSMSEGELGTVDRLTELGCQSQYQGRKSSILSPNIYFPWVRSLGAGCQRPRRGQIVRIVRRASSPVLLPLPAQSKATGEERPFYISIVATEGKEDDRTTSKKNDQARRETRRAWR